MPKTGKPMSVRMTNCGPLGWVTDERGYRYQPHPSGDRRAVAADAAASARRLAGARRLSASAEACLINVYGAEARMGLHQDRDEQDFAAPVVSLSLGDTCLFRIGGTKRNDPTRRSGSPPATRWCSAARRGSPSTASTASCPARRRCCRRAAASISRCGG